MAENSEILTIKGYAQEQLASFEWILTVNAYV